MKTLAEAVERFLRVSNEHQVASEAYGYVKQILAKAQKFTHVRHQSCLIKYPGFEHLLKLEDKLETALVGLDIRLKGARIMLEMLLNSRTH